MIPGFLTATDPTLRTADTIVPALTMLQPLGGIRPVEASPEHDCYLDCVDSGSQKSYCFRVCYNKV